MAMTSENGVLTYKSEVETGTSKSGNAWEKMTIVVACENRATNYDKVALTAFGDKVNECKDIKVGDKVCVTYSVSAREYNGRWFNDVSLFHIERLEASAPTAVPQTQPIPDNPDNDLPF